EERRERRDAQEHDPFAALVGAASGEGRHFSTSLAQRDGAARESRAVRLPVSARRPGSSSACVPEAAVNFRVQVRDFLTLHFGKCTILCTVRILRYSLALPRTPPFS